MDSRHARDLVALLLKNNNLDQAQVYTELKSLGVKTTGYDHEINRAVQAAVTTLRTFQGIAEGVVEKTEAVKIKSLVQSINSHVKSTDRCDDLSSCIQMILYKTTKAPDKVIPQNLQIFYDRAQRILMLADIDAVNAALHRAWNEQVTAQNKINSNDGLDPNAMENLINWSLPFSTPAQQFLLQTGRTPLTDDQLLEIYVHTEALYGQMIPASNI